MLKNVIDFLNKLLIAHTVNKDQNSVSFSVKAKNSSFNCFGQIEDRISIFTFYSNISAIVPESKRMAIAELITRINYDLMIGNFEMDFNDGEVRYKTSIDFEGTELSEPLIKNLIDANISIADDYFYGIIECITTELSPEHIVEKLEKREK